jgi:hypothetical protein
MAGKKVSLHKVLAELKAVIDDLDKEDPGWTDQQKTKAKHTARVLRNVSDISQSLCTDGGFGIPG